MLSLEIRNSSEMQDFAMHLGKHLKEGDVLSLIGEMGAGKTTFTQGLVRGMGLSDTVTSPTFNIVNRYGKDLPIYHLDFYRLEQEQEIEDLDYETYFYPEGVSVLEWAERVDGYLPEKMIQVVIQKVDEHTRHITIPGGHQRERELIEVLRDEGFSG